jgi:hypothetical protein
VYLYTLDAARRSVSSTASVKANDGIKNAPGSKPEFALRGLGEGSHRIMLGDTEIYIKEIRLGGATVPDQRIELKEGQQITGAQIVLAADLGTLKGKINNFNKSTKTFVIMIPPGNNLTDAFTSSRHGLIKDNGTFELKAPPGDYSVIVVTEKEKFDPKIETQEEFLKRLVKNAAAAHIKANEAAEITLEMPDR